MLPILPGYSYWVSPGSGVNGGCLFGVDLAGRITYRDEYEGCLSGRGTSTLTLNGVAVNVDARRLSTKHFSIIQAGLSRQPSHVIQRYRLLPTLAPTTYGGWLTRGDLWPSLGLSVGVDGRLDYPASADAWISGRGTDTLVLHGHRVEIDATATAPGTFQIPDSGGDALDRGVVHTLRLPPVRYSFDSEFRFSVREQDGTLELGEDAGPCISARGTRLTVGCAPPRAPEPTPPPPPAPPLPPPPVPAPQITDIQTAGSVAQGSPLLASAILDRAAKRIDWDLTGDGRYDVSCPGDQPHLRFRPTADLITARAVGDGTATAPVTRRLVRVRTAGASGMTPKLLAKTLAEPAYACASAVSAIDLDPRTPISVLNQQPCLSRTVTRGPLLVTGCLRQVVAAEQIPEAERRTLVELLGQRYGGAAIGATDTWIADGGVRVNGVVITPADGRRGRAQRPARQHRLRRRADRGRRHPARRPPRLPDRHRRRRRAPAARPLRARRRAQRAGRAGARR